VYGEVLKSSCKLLVLLVFPKVHAFVSTDGEGIATLRGRGLGVTFGGDALDGRTSGGEAGDRQKGSIVLQEAGESPVSV